MTAEDYVNDVAFELRDLPWRTRRDLVSDVRGHLDELPAGTDLGARPGTPKDYAADLRSAAGLERRRGAIAFLRARGPRTLILAVLALTVTGLAIGSVVRINRYQPLAFQNGESPPLGYVEAPGGDSESVLFRKGRPFRLGIDIKNTGRYTVRVLGVSYGPGRQLFTAELHMSGPKPAASSGFHHHSSVSIRST